MMNRDVQPRSGNGRILTTISPEWMDHGGNLDPPSEAAVNVPSLNGPTSGYTQNFWIGAKNVVNGSKPMLRHLTRSQL